MITAVSLPRVRPLSMGEPWTATHRPDWACTRAYGSRVRLTRWAGPAAAGRRGGPGPGRMFAYELRRRLTAADAQIFRSPAHPGAVRTGLQRHLPGPRAEQGLRARHRLGAKDRTAFLPDCGSTVFW
jgi:hypothetical protein